MAPQKFQELIIKHLLLECAISSAKTEEHLKLIHSWADTSLVTDLKGDPIEDFVLSIKHKHFIVRRIYTSVEIQLEEK